MRNKNEQEEDLALVVSRRVGDVESLEKDTTRDAVFGEITEGGPNYRNVGIRV